MQFFLRIFFTKRRVWKAKESWKIRGLKSGEYRSPWPKVDYAWVDGSVPKKGSRAAPRPRAKWYRLRGWESWTRGWTTLSRFPPHSRGSPSTPWTFLLPRDRKIHDLKRGSSPPSLSNFVYGCSSSITEHNKDLYSMPLPSFATLAPAFFPSSSESIIHTLKTSGFLQFAFRRFALDLETLSNYVSFLISTPFSF